MANLGQDNEDLSELLVYECPKPPLYWMKCPNLTPPTIPSSSTGQIYGGTIVFKTEENNIEVDFKTELIR